VLVQCNLKVTIGNYVQIGEFTSIRDTTHMYNDDNLIMFSADKSAEIFIGNNVWIGRNCLICEGSIIEDNVVIAAHSVVKGKLSSGYVYGGAPAKMIKSKV
jgi:acetyltransferase-like isoleucine patch superfamily enzyme